MWRALRPRPGECARSLPGFSAVRCAIAASVRPDSPCVTWRAKKSDRVAEISILSSTTTFSVLCRISEGRAPSSIQAIQGNPYSPRTLKTMRQKLRFAPREPKSLSNNPQDSPPQRVFYSPLKIRRSFAIFGSRKSTRQRLFAFHTFRRPKPRDEPKEPKTCRAKHKSAAYRRRHQTTTTSTPKQPC